MLSKSFLDNFLLEQSVIEQRLTHDKMIAVKLHSAVDAAMIKNNASRQFFHKQTQQENTEVTLCFPKYISFSK